MVICMRCGASNNPDQNYCSSCGATLPKLAYTMEMASVDKVMDLYDKFYDAVEMLKNGETSIEEFEAFIRSMQKRLGSKEDEIRDVPISDDIMDDFVTELDLGFAGIDKINEAVNVFLSFIETEDEHLLDSGLELVFKGMELIHQAKIFNRERDKRLSHDADAYRSEGTLEL